MLYNEVRPKRFDAVVGQESEVQVIKTVLEKNWKPSAILITGPFGCGKTSLARLIGRAILCDNRQGVEPCGSCHSCLAMDTDSHPAYLEIDAASHGLVGDIRTLKDEALYKVVGGKTRIIVFDEAHMISAQGQNAMLQILEEGKVGLLFMFATTEAEKMLPTVRSRCVELDLKVLTTAQVYQQLKTVSELKKITADDRALRVIATYSRGHLRDALVLLEQMARTSAGQVTEELVRVHLRLDKMAELYLFLVEDDQAEAVKRLEVLLCSYSVGELAENLAQALVDAYKIQLGIGDYAEIDRAMLEKILLIQGKENLLYRAEQLLSLHTDFASINYGLAAVMRVFFSENGHASRVGTRTLVPGASASPQTFRKPSKPLPTESA